MTDAPTGFDRFEYAYLDYLVATIGPNPNPADPSTFCRVAAMIENGEHMTVIANAPMMLQVLNHFGRQGWQQIVENKVDETHSAASLILAEVHKTVPGASAIAPNYWRSTMMRRIW